MDKQKYVRKIATKRKGGYISTKDIIKIIEEAIKEYKEDLIANPKDLIKLFPDIVYCKTNAISGQDLRGVK